MDDELIRGRRLGSSVFSSTLELARFLKAQVPDSFGSKTFSHEHRISLARLASQVRISLNSYIGATEGAVEG
jgi:hypothetical protein